MKVTIKSKCALVFSDKPTITSFVNQKIITAPSLLDFAFSVDSFPSSNVTIFHETKRLTFIPNVTGQLSFNVHVSVKSCLDQGEYTIEAVNDAGSDRFIFIADVKCKIQNYYFIIKGIKYITHIMIILFENNVRI